MPGTDHPRLRILSREFRAKLDSEEEEYLAMQRVGGLLELIRDQFSSPVRMVETGCLRGVSTEVFAICAEHITTVDTAFSTEARYRLMNYTNVTMVEGDSLQVAGSMADGTFDFVYLDSDHAEDFVAAEIAAWLPKIKPGGLMGGHDYSRWSPSVVAAVERYFDKPDKVYADTSWIVSLTPDRRGRAISRH